MSNKFIVAAAGSGKTTTLVRKALEITDGNVLITTFTEANEKEIRKKIIHEHRCIPINITVQTWFSFLIQHGVKPYQGGVFDRRIKGMILVEGRSGIKFRKKSNPVYYHEEKEFEQHYFSKDLKIYSDKLSKFVLRCNDACNGKVFDRISRCFQYIYIDEVQDLSGYDFGILEQLFNCSSETILVGDPRQGTYSTSNSAKNKKYVKSNIVRYFEDKTLDVDIDDKSLIINYRSVKEICDLSNGLYPEHKSVSSGNKYQTGHDGVFVVKPSDVEEYLKMYKPVQLRDSVKVNVNDNYEVMNFGASKGLSFDRVMIYPTKPMTQWLKNNDSDLKPTSRSKFYVALTRARQSVAIVSELDEKHGVEGVVHFQIGTNQTNAQVANDPPSEIT